MRWLAGSALALLICGALAGFYVYWTYEAPRASGPLVEDMIAGIDPETNDSDLREVVAAHIDPSIAIVEQQQFFHANGFDCFISPVEVTGSQYLICRRPIEGRHYCEQLFYYVYQTAEGEVVNRLATIIQGDNSDRVLGRCSYRPFPEDEPIERYPHGT